MKNTRIWKKLTLVGSQGFLLVSGGTCLPDNLFAETAGEIVNGLIIAGFNMVLTGSGFQV